MVLGSVPIRSATISTLLTLCWCVCVNTSGAVCKPILLSRHDIYSDYYNEVSDEEQEQPAYPQNAALNDGMNYELLIKCEKLCVSNLSCLVYILRKKCRWMQNEHV